MRRRALTLSLAATFALTAFVGPQFASSAPTDLGDLRSEREEIRAERARVASEIDTSKASKAEIDDALEAIQADLDAQQAALDKARADLEDAKREVTEAEEAIEELTEEISVLRDEMGERAVQAFVNPPEEELLASLESRDFTSATEQRFYADLRSQDDADLEDRLTGAQVDLEAQRERAEDARERAIEKEAEQAARTESVAAAEGRQKKLADELQAHINAEVARSLELADSDRELSAKIAEEQAALQARLASLQKEAERVQAEEEAAARQAAAQQPSTPPSSGGGGGGPISSSPGGSDAGVPLAYVQGVPVNAAVADQVVAMINAAARDGISLRIGNSYRSVSHQIQLRKQNCGTSHYAIYQMPSGQCRPPTATPGNSQHQLGLAIDFANCSTRGTDCYKWLAGNAARFGYHNLPSEPWHWSTTGR